MLLQVADAKAHILLPIIQERIDICSDLAGTKGLELYQIYVRQNKMEKKRLFVSKCGLIYIEK